MAEHYEWECGCVIDVDGFKVTSKRCEEHKKRWPHRLDKEKH